MPRRNHYNRPYLRHVETIIKAHPSETVRGLARELGMPAQNVRDIRNGKTYRDVMPEVERVPFWSRQGGCTACRFHTPGDRNRHNREPTSYAQCELDIKEFREAARPKSVGLTCPYFQPASLAEKWKLSTIDKPSVW